MITDELRAQLAAVEHGARAAAGSVPLPHRLFVEAAVDTLSAIANAIVGNQLELERRLVELERKLNQ
jgi:hypothetical protein